MKYLTFPQCDVNVAESSVSNFLLDFQFLVGDDIPFVMFEGLGHGSLKVGRPAKLLAVDHLQHGIEDVAVIGVAVDVVVVKVSGQFNATVL